MDDDWKVNKRNKPQQVLYKPGSGPLRRSSNGLEKMSSYSNLSNGPRGKDHSHYGSKSSMYEEEGYTKEHGSVRNRKPEQPLYVAKSGESKADDDRYSKPARYEHSNQNYSRRYSNSKNEKHFNNSGFSRSGPPKRDRSRGDSHNKDNNDVNYNRNFRQVSEPRSMSPSHHIPPKCVSERNRDTRSMEVSAGRQNAGSGSKPPSGRRNSSGYPESPRPKYMLNLENLPPRLKKKFLEQSGHKFDSNEHLSRESYTNNVQSHYSHNPHYSQPSSWSQTLPSRGRGRLRDNEEFDKEKFMNSYLKSCDLQQHSRRSTPSSSYMNLYEPDYVEKNNIHLISDGNYPTQHFQTASTNGINNIRSSNKEEDYSKDESDSEPVSSSTNLMDMTNLDWNEEVENSMKLDEICDSTTSSPTQSMKTLSISQNAKPVENPKPETKEPSKRGGKSRRREKRSSSRGQRNDKKAERSRRDSGQQEPAGGTRARERRDSHRSTRSSNMGNSRDDLDRWRSLRSFSRDHSVEGRIVSQCNSRDGSVNRASSPRDLDGFRIPTSVPKHNNCATEQVQKKEEPAVVERGRQSPAGAEGGRSRRARQGGRRQRHADAGPANWREEILESHKHDRHDRNHEMKRNRNNSHSDKSVSESSTSHPGLLILPQGSMTQVQNDRNNSKESPPPGCKTLFDPSNPSKPVAAARGGRRGARGGRGADAPHRALLQEVDRADALLHAHTLRSPLALAARWPDVAHTRQFLQDALHKLLMTDLKYCQTENIEQHFWKILYYNFIESLRKSLPQLTPEDKPAVVGLINTIIDEGHGYFENLIQVLEKNYKFNTDDYINDNQSVPPKGLGYVGVALVSVQKLYIFLGDLARYKEQVNETNNYAKSKFCYTKAQQINPKNGRPYNQLAILAIYARRKLDAVYYYMRSLMSSNPFHSARESLISLFEENRKKYEAAERKRRVAAGAGAGPEGGAAGGGRRETWALPVATHPLHDITPVELNKNFITSYLHVHGKLVTKIGMESFHGCASLMLRQFRALLHQQPLPTPAARLLQLTALNMFAVETIIGNTKEGTSEESESSRSAWLECALGVALLMFGVLLERCCALLPEPADTQQHTDALLLLPAIKVWSDWMLCHSSIWNPPPSFQNFDLGNESDPWEWLAKMMNILESLDDKSIEFETQMKEGSEAVRLPEDSAMAGFTPLLYMEPTPAFAHYDKMAPLLAEQTLRTRKLLFFGTEYLVGVDPPVLRLEYVAGGPPRYVSAVPRHPLQPVTLTDLTEDLEEEAVSAQTPARAEHGREPGPDADEATRRLLRRKDQLEARRASMELRRQRLHELVRAGSVSVEVEVRPRWLVPDTNCFIDHLPLLQRLATTPPQPYVFAVPLVVVTELEGLRLSGRVGAAAAAALGWVRAQPGVRLATSRGSLLASRAFTAEDAAPATNDDRVLATALNLHANVNSEPEVGGSCGVVRRVCEVVLLTDDRNLRVKALTADLPARPLPAFARWALPDQSAGVPPAPAPAADA